MSKRFKVGDLVVADEATLRDRGRGIGIIIRKEPAEHPDKRHRLDFTVLWSSRGWVEDGLWSEELEPWVNR